MTEYHITNVGGVAEATLDLLPGVNLLVGANGSGKTSAIDALVKAHGGDAKIERRDGTRKGEVTGPGVHIIVGRNVRKGKGDEVESDQAELRLADLAPLSDLIDPQVKDSDLAARHRIAGLVRLLELQLDDAAIDTLAAGDEALLKWLVTHCQDEGITDLIAAAEAMRQHAHRLARSSEATAEEAKGQAKALSAHADELAEKIGGEGKLVSTPVEEAREGYVEALREHDRAVARCEAREELEARQAEIRESLGEEPDDGPAIEAQAQAEKTLEAAALQVEELEAKLAAARRAWEAAKVDLERAQERRDQVGMARARWREQAAILDREPEGETRDQVAKLATRVTIADRLQERARISLQHREAEAAMTAADQERDAAEKRAEALRKHARSVPDLLGEILAEKGAKGLSVIDGRLHATIDDRGALDFADRLSEGQRIRVALDVAASVYHDQVLALRGDLWNALDPENQQDFAARAVEHRLRVITESPAEGEMRLEWMGGESD